MAHSVFCSECDEEIDAELIRDEFEDYLDFPDNCPKCGHNTESVYIPGVKHSDSGREDFHSDC